MNESINYFKWHLDDDHHCILNRIHHQMLRLVTAHTHTKHYRTKHMNQTNADTTQLWPLAAEREHSFD